jgi:hypothetical protein
MPANMPSTLPPPMDTIDPRYLMPSNVARTGMRPLPPSAWTTAGGTSM